MSRRHGISCGGLVIISSDSFAVESVVMAARLGTVHKPGCPCVLLGIGTQVLLLPRQAFYSLSYLSSLYFSHFLETLPTSDSNLLFSLRLSFFLSGSVLGHSESYRDD